MADSDQLESLRAITSGLHKELEQHREAIERIEEALRGLAIAKDLLQRDGKQGHLPGTGPFGKMKPEEIALHVVESEDRAWTAREVVDQAEFGGKDLTRYKNAYAVFYTALIRLVEKKRIEADYFTGRKGGAPFRKKVFCRIR